MIEANVKSKRLARLLTAALISGALLLSGCTGLTTTMTAGENSEVLVRSARVLTVPAFDADSAAKDVEPFLAADRGSYPRVITISWFSGPLEDGFDPQVLAQARAHAESLKAEGDVVKLERSTFYFKGLRYRVSDAKADPLNWYEAQGVSNNFGRATRRNLNLQTSAQDRAQPREIDPPNPQAAVGAVERYQKGQVRALSDVSLEAGGSSSE